MTNILKKILNQNSEFHHGVPVLWLGPTVLLSGSWVRILMKAKTVQKLTKRVRSK